MINFKLNHIDNIFPFGPKGDKTLHLFALTDGAYWMKINSSNLFEYTDEILNHWGGTCKYAEYQIMRFIEEFSSLFFKITEPIPSDLYVYVNSAKLLKQIEAQKVLWEGEKMDSGGKEIIYEESFGWILDRTLNSHHLTAAPCISFFRNNDKITIVWIADQLVENRIPIWTAQTGEVEMDFEDFVFHVEDFGKKFLAKMERQINNAVEKDWGPILIDKIKLKEQYIGLAGDFDYWIKILRQDVLYQSLRKHGSIPETNWESIRKNIQSMI